MPPPPDPSTHEARIRLDRPLRPVAESRVTRWAGTRLAPPDGTGERWLAAPGLQAGQATGAVTLDDLAASAGASFIGRDAAALVGHRFPLIVKLIDAGAWLSLQVHPDDDLARRLYGPDAVGKAEAWLVLEAGDDARLITGPAAGLDASDLRAGIASGELGREQCQDRAAIAGDALMLEAGTLHAIGAGTLVYEIEQPSDLTFRVSDWGRPPVPGRTLHLSEALEAVRPEAHAIEVGREFALDGGRLEVREFRLEIVAGDGPHPRHPGGRSLEVVTAIGGPVTLTGPGWTETLAPWETAVVPAIVDAYAIDAAGGRACVGTVPAPAA